MAKIQKDELAQQTYEHYPTYPDANDKNVKDFCKAVSAQHAMYRAKQGSFAFPFVIEAAEEMPAYKWWDQHGSSVSELQYVACLVLAQPASASICERINSEFSFVKDRRRYRLKHEHANKLVSLFHNLRILRKMKKPDYIEPAVGWNEEVDLSGITRYGVSHWR